jgi:hypothetical protein
MNENNAHQPAVTGCLLKVVVSAFSFVLLVIFFLGILAGMVIASGL